MKQKVIEEMIQMGKGEVIEWRRFLHKYPELSFQEGKTAQFVYETLHSFGNLEISRPTKTSVMARLIGAQPGKIVAIRADIDALPIQEENTFEFASQNPGVMHACGHDGHTAMLLGTAKILSGMKAQINGEVRFLFQHAEELFPGGAEEMVQAGVMDGVDMIIGTHLLSSLPTGKIGVGYGPIMAASDEFIITVVGKGGHAASPHKTVDPIAIAAQVVTNLQHIVARNADPLGNLVVSITKFVGGTAFNVIPNSVEIWGTARSFNPELRESIPGLMERVVKGITEAHGATYQFTYDDGYRAVINEEGLTRVIEETVNEVCGEDALVMMKPEMGGEDFSAFLQKAPGTYFYTGAGNPEKGSDYPHHHPRFTVDEDALEHGVKMFVHATFKLLAS